MSKNLIVYFSRIGENYFRGEVRSISKGNTEVAAEYIQQSTGGELFELKPLIAYSDNYKTCVEEARKYVIEDARPECVSYPESIAEYDVIYLGYPNYYDTMPMHMFTFLEKYDFSGKTIKPFCTHEGSGMGKSEEHIKKLCPNAKLGIGLAIRGSDVEEAKEIIENWI